MKKSHLLPAIVIALSVIFLVDCKEKEDIIPQTNSTPKGPYASIDEVFEELRVKPKSVTINAEKDNSFYGNSGTRYIIFGNTLVKSDGTPVTGEVEVQVSEFIDEGDMIFSKMLPISDGKPLASGGQIDIKITQGGEALKLKDGATLEANIPQGKEADPKMEFFEGEKKDDGGANLVNWKRPEIDSAAWWRNRVQPVWNNNQTVLSDTLKIVTSDIMLVNADHFMNPDYKDFSVVLKCDDFDVDKTEFSSFCYAMYDDYKGAWIIGYNFREGKTWNNHVPDIPVHFVAFTVVDGEFYGGVLAATPEDNVVYEIKLTKQDPVEFRKMMNNL